MHLSPWYLCGSSRLSSRSIVTHRNSMVGDLPIIVALNIKRRSNNRLLMLESGAKLKLLNELRRSEATVTFLGWDLSSRLNEFLQQFEAFLVRNGLVCSFEIQVLICSKLLFFSKSLYGKITTLKGIFCFSF